MQPCKNFSPEKLFIRHSLVLFMGGAMDDVYGPLFQGVFIPYRQRYSTHQDIAYATHAVSTASLELVHRWGQAGKQVCLVGHSWGGNSVVKIARRLSSAVDITLLVTLDPVSRRIPGWQVRKPANVAHWVNVYVDYRTASMEYSNIVARLGGYWGECRYADENIVLSHDASGEITHARAARMFQEVATKVKRL